VLQQDVGDQGACQGSVGGESTNQSSQGLQTQQQQQQLMSPESSVSNAVSSSTRVTRAETALQGRLGLCHVSKSAAYTEACAVHATQDTRGMHSDARRRNRANSSDSQRWWGQRR
jgi:hypothetical protein